MTKKVKSGKIVGMMKFGFLSFLVFLVLSVAVQGCASSKDGPPPVSEPEQTQEEAITVQDEPAAVAQEEPAAAETANDAEYLRSIAAVSSSETISMDTFTHDKKEILELIDQIEAAMRSGNYQKWLSYVEPSSIRYWQDARNLKEIEGRLPVKGLKINNMQDYFKYIFVPARYIKVL